MCSECHRMICPSGCPNAPEETEVYTCEHCGESIVVDDEYYEFEGKQYHYDCFPDAAVAILVRNGAVYGYAEMEEPDFEYDD